MTSLSISDAGHTAVIEKIGATATLRVDGNPVYDFLVKSETDEEDGDKVMIYNHGFMIGPGNYYVDGLLCENDYEIDFTNQQSLPPNPRTQSNPQISTWPTLTSGSIMLPIWRTRIYESRHSVTLTRRLEAR